MMAQWFYRYIFCNLMIVSKEQILPKLFESFSGGKFPYIFYEVSIVKSKSDKNHSIKIHYGWISIMEIDTKITIISKLNQEMY